ncbi:MAG: Uma2 family endonuclease [Planctomycetota bacterium]|nr:Uma2 family endonuclease [Planctomycetota bacterium]
MVATDIARNPTPAEAARIPRLEPGDRLTQQEFRRRFEAMPACDHAQLIEGVVYMPSPVSAERHGEPHADVLTWLGCYRARTPQVRAGDNSTLWLDVDNAPQPDCYLRLEEQAGGQSRVEDGYIFGAPELIVEISSSSVSYDLHDKLTAYQRNGVREYIVWRVQDGEIDWFVLQESRFIRAAADERGVYRSAMFPGLWLESRALVQRDLAQVLDVLQAGLDSDEHRKFVHQVQ